ncbi:polysaccharide lyase [Nitrosospira sp. Nsp1]|uniref:polysaccharide lyase n=1 Tax=Nitrosospira sp. Nsp1 TaxID=136547 RepID=UPI0008856F3B|nr:polysaccharide lyase [Nitrosospira sp. Nsp1]SCX48956.1 PEP-CTERM protein-sorting domain-containing protein [Nitrosospira sp. Nsp1]
MIRSEFIFSGLVFALSCNYAYAEIVFDGRFSSGDFSGYRALEANGNVVSGISTPSGVPGRLERVQDPAGSANSVMRATYIADDIATHSGYRSEASAFIDPVGSERWYSWGYYLPDTWKYVKVGSAIAQILNAPDKNESGFRNPTLALIVQDNKMKLINAFDHDAITSPADIKSIAGIDFERRELTSWELETGRWTYLDLHVKWAADDTGSLEFWKDGVLLFQEHDHINTFNDKAGVWFKNGIYSWSPGTESISAYSTGVLIGDGKETFQSMSMSVVSEPSSYMMMMAGIAGIGFFAARRRFSPGSAGTNT